MSSYTATYTFDDATIYSDFLSALQNSSVVTVVSYDEPTMSVTFIVDSTLN